MSGDLGSLDTREKAHEGAEVPLVVNGETFMGDDDKPVVFTIRGMADPEVHRLILQGQKTGSRTPAQVLEADLKLARAAVIGWSDNVKIDGQLVPFSRDAIATVFSIPVVRSAILAEVFVTANFMKGA